MQHICLAQCIQAYPGYYVASKLRSFTPGKLCGIFILGSLLPNHALPPTNVLQIDILF
jgi:hypothetical protein